MSRLAGWCLALALVPLFIGALTYVADDMSSAVAGVLGVVAFASIAAALIVGVLALVRIHRSGGSVKGRGLVFGGLAVALLWVVTAIAITLGSSGVLLEDDFEGQQNFTTDDDPLVRQRYVDGVYEVMVKDASVPETARSFFDERAQQGLTFEVDVEIVEAPEEDFFVGLGCYPGNEGYVLGLTPTGEYAVAQQFSDRPGRVLEQGTFEQGLGPGDSGRLGITCVGGGSGPTALELRLDGRRVVRVEHQGGYDSFVAVGFYINTTEDGTLVRFDNALAKAA